MAKYLFQASYTSDGTEGLRTQGGSARRDAVTATAESLDGQIESFYYAFGDHDVYVIAELPDDEAATALALTVNATGAVTLTTTVLLTVEQVDAAAKRSVDYSPPGS